MEMKNIDNVIRNYVQALANYYSYLAKVSQNDLSKWPLILNNDEEAEKLYWQMQNALKDFDYETMTEGLHTFSKGWKPIIESINENLEDVRLNRASIKELLDSLRGNDFDIQSIISEYDDDEIIDAYLGALEYLHRLPHFDPDNWLKRNFLVGRVYISSDVDKVHQRVTQGFREARTCFIYGLYSATCAMSRSVLEFMLKDRFPVLKKSKKTGLGDILDKWNNIDGLKQHPEEKKKANMIKEAGNYALHEGDDNMKYVFNEMTAHTVLQNLKELIEFFYK